MAITKIVGAQELVKLTDAGLYCEAGDFYIDPWRPVGRAIITHAHSDHARPGNTHYLAAESGMKLLKSRLEPGSSIQTIKYGEPITVKGVRVSLHSAGHVLGSAQVRIEKDGEIWVVSGDYKIEPEATCAPFELVRCHTFITESTFGLPIFRWRPQEEIFEEINNWWRANKEAGKASVLFGYALGKAQRILSGVDSDIGPIYTHGAVERLNAAYRDSGIALPKTTYAATMPRGTKYGGSLIVAPPSAQATPWMRTFGTVSTAFASGWMRIRGTRRAKAIDRGFVLSDHADWTALNKVIRETGAEHVIVTHGYAPEMVRWLNESGLRASSFSTAFEGEREELQPARTESDTVTGEQVLSNSAHESTSGQSADRPEQGAKESREGKFHEDSELNSLANSGSALERDFGSNPSFHSSPSDSQQTSSESDNTDKDNHSRINAELFF